ncbi:MAG: TonB family protein [Deltaproteobacteria bacterium]|nr:TonB family protein [Deltaproteobacteria bacterium]
MAALVAMMPRLAALLAIARLLAITRLLAIALLLDEGAAWAEASTATSTATGTSTATATSTAASALTRPRPLASIAIETPPGAPRLSFTVEVTVRLSVDASGQVTQVALLRSAGEPFDGAVVAGAARFRFEPARYAGTPVPVEINFTQRFEPSPPRPTIAPGPPLGRLSGRLEERGTRTPIRYAIIDAVVGDTRSSTTSDALGNFDLLLPEGAARISLSAPGFEVFIQDEQITAGAHASVTYLLERSGPDPFEVVVRAARDRRELGRAILRGAEIAQAPGTFGDPFRVISALPGVSSLASLFPYPIVRGSSPGNTGFLIDGVRVPLLFHLLAGPSVIHPALIEELDFSPGGFPVTYGGYTGGIVNGRLHRADRTEQTVDADLNLLQAGALVRRAIKPLDWTITAAGRVGYPGFLIGLATPRVSLSYWDYQARIDGGDRRSGYSIFWFGARDALDAIPNGRPDSAPQKPLFRAEFHRVDLAYHHRSSAIEGEYRVAFGYDDSLLSSEDSLSDWSLTPRFRWTLAMSPQVALGFGLDGTLKATELAASNDGPLAQLVGNVGRPNGKLYSGGLLLEVQLAPTEDLRLRPGIRADVYHDSSATFAGLDPRIEARYRISSRAPELWLTGSLGLYHQPPRFTVPLPGLDELAFRQGLLESLQASVGAELTLGDAWSLDAEAYFNWMDPILYDLQLNPDAEQVQTPPPSSPPGQDPTTQPPATGTLEQRLDQLLRTTTGRAFGLELMLRRQSQSGLSGWIAYTLSRSDRARDGAWPAFDFDRTHLLSLVLSLPLPRRWRVGVRTQVESGRPLTTTAGLAGTRTATFVRLDFRVDKTAVWNDWVLDFYIDVSNALLGAEEVAPETQLRYVLPTLGLRARF